MNPVKPVVIALATLPPPVNGLTVATECFLANTSKSIDWTIKPVGRPSAKRSSGQFARMFRCIKAGVESLIVSRSNVRSIYMPVSAGIAMIYNIAFAAICALRKIPVLVHHHSYSYLNKQSRFMALLNYFLTEKDSQVFLSETMQVAFDRQYARKSHAIVLPNSFAMLASIDEPVAKNVNKQVLKIGHLSNLTIEKGLKTVLDTFEELKRVKDDCELHLAGPVIGTKEQQLITEAQNRFGKSLVMHGPIYGDDKTAFYTSIDYFWFPSQYVNEAQPIVLVEALAFGVFAISIKRGCIEWLLGNAGLVATDEEQFKQFAIERALIDHVAEVRLQEKNRCKERFLELRKEETIGFQNAVSFLSQSLS